MIVSLKAETQKCREDFCVSAFNLFIKPLLAESFFQYFRHSLVSFFCVADVGENLCQRFSMVDFHKMLILGQRLFVGIDAVDVLGRIVMVLFLMDNAFQGQAVGLGRAFVGIAHGDGGKRNDPFGQVQHFDDLVGIINRGSQETGAQSGGFGKCAEVLRKHDGIDAGVHEREQVVVTGFRLALAAPFHEAVEVGAKGQHHGSFRQHRLVEMRRSLAVLSSPGRVSR